MLILLPLAFYLKADQVYGEPSGNANSLSQLISAGVITILYLIFSHEVSKKYLIPSLILIFTSIFFLIELNSRGSFLVLLVAFITMTILQFYKNNMSVITKKHYYFGLISLGLIAIGFVVILTQMETSNFLNIAYRENLWQAGWAIFKDHWFLGIGEGNLSHVLPYYWDINTNLLSGAGETEYHLHNEYLNRAVEGGIISCLLFIGLILYSLHSGISYYLNSKDKNSNLILPLIGIFAGIIIQIFFDRILQFPTTGLFFILICGILIAVNESNGQKPFIITKKWIAILAILHAVFAWPFLYQQYLYVSANNISDLSISKIDQIKEDLSKSTNLDEFNKKVLERLHQYSESSLKESATKLLHENQEFNKSTVNSFAALLIDLELNWSKNFEKILNTTDFKDLKVMTYQKYIRLLGFQNRKVEMVDFILKMNSEFPLMLESTFLKYDYYVNNHEFEKALNCLQESAKLTNNPKLKKKIILHRLKTEKILNIKEMEECIGLRKKIEFDNKFVKKNLVGRFDTFESYYIEFIGELLLMGEYDNGYKILMAYSKESELRKLPNFINLIHYIRTSYPGFYQKLPKDLTSE